MSNIEKPILARQEGDEARTAVPNDKPDHQRAVEFVKRHRDFFEHYGRGDISVEPAPPELNTFASDLGKGTLYVHGRFYHNQGHDLSDEKTSAAVLHELGHLEERMGMLTEEGGPAKFARYLARLKASRAFSLMDNCVADNRENATAVARTNPGVGEIFESMYRDDLFKETDMTAAPRHIQLCQALLRERQVVGEQCAVAPEVRAELEELENIKSATGDSLLDVMTHPDLPMSTRLRLQDQYIWPRVQKLLKQDVEEQKQKDKNQKSQGGKTGDQPSGEPKSGGDPDPNAVFKDAYDKADKQMPHAIPIGDLEKAFKQWQASRGENPLDAADTEYAKKIGVELNKLRQYRQIAQSLEKIMNPATNELVVEELRRLFQRIISKRLKPAPEPKYPVEEGEEMVDPVEIITQAKAGNLQPKAWGTLEIKERLGQKFGEVELTFVFDRSDSMAGQKQIEQQKAAALAMEALKGGGDELESERVNLEKPLTIQTEVYAFSSSAADQKPLKPMSGELSEKERVEVVSALGTVSGSTTDFAPLEKIDSGIAPEALLKIKEGELKKIIFVFTDGGSDKPDRVSAVLKSLRAKGVIVAGIGITKDGEPALTTYAPGARVAGKAENLPVVLADAIQEHLADL